MTNESGPSLIDRVWVDPIAPKVPEVSSLAGKPLAEAVKPLDELVKTLQQLRSSIPVP